MARLTAPLLSFGARGQIAKTQVMASWRGIAYARRYVVPSNPKTESQQHTRGVFTWLNQVWKFLDPEAHAPWFLYAKGRPLTDRNAFIKSNLAILRGTDEFPVTTITPFLGSPGANGGLAPVSILTVDLDDQHLGVTLNAPDLPPDWGIVSASCLVFEQQNAGTGHSYESRYDEDDEAPFTFDFDVEVAGTYVAIGWFKFTKPDGSFAYGISKSAAQVIAVTP